MRGERRPLKLCLHMCEVLVKVRQNLARVVRVPPGADRGPAGDDSDAYGNVDNLEKQPRVQGLG